MKTKSSGFTILELMIVITIVAIIGAIVGAQIKKRFGTNDHSNYAPAPTPALQTSGGPQTTIKCIEGLVFIVGSDGSTVQVLDENGNGERCEARKVP